MSFALNQKCFFYNNIAVNDAWGTQTSTIKSQHTQ